ncbi:MAG TPA: exodeoxyribonuclease III [Treponemataceae bacterium]|nr:exodeoxyribonuclease III [Treponemataceae bacterium]
MTKIISWNVNGIRAVERKGKIQLLLKKNADILCLQETKAKPDQLSDMLREPGAEKDTEIPRYYAYWASAKRPGYSGTAIYSKKEPDNISLLNVSEFDDEGRVIAATYGTTVVISAYFPNSQAEGKRLAYKIDFCNAINDFCNGLVAQGKNIVLCGDYNIAHKPIDLANPTTNEKNPGYLPEEREAMTKFLNLGYIDTFRAFCKKPNQYTWWSYRFKARERNIGWRIDYQCVNKDFMPEVVSSNIHADFMGSDHCPIEIELKTDL